MAWQNLAEDIAEEFAKTEPLPIGLSVRRRSGPSGKPSKEAVRAWKARQREKELRRRAMQDFARACVREYDGSEYALERLRMAWRSLQTA